MSKSIILFSGGVDSTVLLALALSEGKTCLALSFDYGQRHKIELEAAKKIVTFYQVEHTIIIIDPSSFKHSSLIGHAPVPKNRHEGERMDGTTPSTYVPARNTLFLAYALVQAEIHEADEIYFGPNLLDQNAYPDCRPSFVESFQQVANYATKQAKEGRSPRIITPLISMDKRAIVKLGMQLKAPLSMTHSCYDPSEGGQPCKSCDACLIRQDAFCC